MKKKYLAFTCRGETFIVDENGFIIQEARFQQALKNRSAPDFSGNWMLLGVSFHHWTSHIEIEFKRIWEKPELMIGGRVWDVDHGTIRIWSGQYCGKLPRVTRAHAVEA